MNKPVIIIGNGGHAAVVTEALIQLNRTIIGFTAPDFQMNRYGLNYIGTDDCIYQFEKNEIELVLAIGTVNISQTRESIFNTFKSQGYSFAIIVHPTAIISSTAKIGEGSQIMAGAIIQSNTVIADNCIINTGTIVDHDCYIADHVHLATGCTLSGGVKVDVGCHIGTGATIIQNIHIGQYVLVGAGAVVVRNVTNFSKVRGVPAKEV